MVPPDAWVLTEPCPASKPGCWPWKASVLEQSTVRGNAIVRKNTVSSEHSLVVRVLMDVIVFF